MSEELKELKRRKVWDSFDSKELRDKVIILALEMQACIGAKEIDAKAYEIKTLIRTATLDEVKEAVDEEVRYRYPTQSRGYIDSLKLKNAIDNLRGSDE